MNTMESDVLESTLPQDLEQTLIRMEALLAHPDAPECAAALRVQVAALLSWGEVLNLEEFVSLAQAAITLMRLSPEQAPMIAQLALGGFRAVYQLKSLAQLSPSDLRGQFPAPLSEASLALTMPPAPWTLGEQLQTPHLFVWQMGDILYTLPSDDVAEILIPKPEQLVAAESKPGMRWQDQVIPLYHLLPSAGVTSSSTAPSLLNSVIPGVGNDTNTVLVIDQEEQALALGVVIDALVTDPELPLLKQDGEEPSPPYVHGYTLRAGQLTVVINVIDLLDAFLNQAPQVALPPVTSSGLGTQEGAVSLNSSSTQRITPTILVVDDSQTLRQILALTLQNAGYEVIQAQDGRDALAQLQENDAVQLIVCDVEMPNMNGFEFLSQCRRDPKWAKLPVVMLSTFSDEQHRHLASTFGATAYFGKPYNEAEFLAALRSMIV